MRRRKGRRNIEVFSLSFLDVICCGFGAVILLLVIVKIFEPIHQEMSQDEVEARVVWLQQRLEDLRNDQEVVSTRVSQTEAELEFDRRRLEDLRAELQRIQSSGDEARQQAESAAELEARLERARQELSEEMRRLLTDYRPRYADSPIGGIPIDSEYVIFVIDTSPSMTNYTWPRMMEVMEQILDMYPQVQGMQVMNDMGTYLFSRYAGEWIADTPGLRSAVLEGLRNWRPFSNSSPVEGLVTAVRTYGTREHNVSVYYLGDEMAGRNLDQAVRTVERANAGPNGDRLVRIHSIGFPVIYDYTGSVQQTAFRFATLMRLITEGNDGAFVALPSDPARRRAF